MLLRTFILIIFCFFICILIISCSQQNNASTSNNDPALVGKWIRNNRYHLDLYSNGIGSKEKDVKVNEDIKKFKKERINWVTFNNNFLMINADEKIMGFSYQVKGDTLFIRQPDDALEYFVRAKDASPIK